MSDLKNALIEVLQDLPLSVIPEDESINLLQSGGTVDISHEEQLSDDLTLPILRRLEVCFQHYLYYENEDRRKDRNMKLQYKHKPSTNLWEVLTSNDTYAKVFGTDEIAKGSLHASLFALLHVSMKAVRKFKEKITIENIDKLSTDFVSEQIDILICALCAARIYMLWIQISGGSAYGIFMPYQYCRMMDVINCWMELFTCIVACQAVDKSGKHGQVREVNERVPNDAANASNTKKLRKNGFETLIELQRVLQHVSLSSTTDCIVSTAESVIHMQRMCHHVSTVLDIKPISLRILQHLQSNLHGDMAQLTRALIQLYLPGITLQEDAHHEAAHHLRNIVHYHKLSIIAVDQTLSTYEEYLQEMEFDTGADEKQKRNDIMSEIQLSFLQNLCLNVPERAEKRQKLLQYFLIKACGSVTPSESSSFGMHATDRAQLIRFLTSYSKNKYAKCRLFVVEIVADLLLKPLFWNYSCSAIPSSGQQYAGAAPLLKILLDRSQDKSSNVRAKAIAGISNAIAVGLRSERFDTAQENKSIEEVNMRLAEDEVCELEAALKNLLLDEGTAVEHASTNKIEVDLLEVFRVSLVDDKMSVRRAAIRALEALLIALPKFLEKDKCSELYEMQERCSDSSLLVRMQAVRSLTSILNHYPDNRDAQKVWLIGILPLSVDPEPSVQKSVLDAIYSTIFEPLVSWYQSCQTVEHQFAKTSIWKLMEQLNGAMVRCCQRALRQLISNSKVDQKQIIALSMHAIKLSVTASTAPDQGEEDVITCFWNCGWILLEEITRFVDIISCIDKEQCKYLDTVITCWNKLQNGDLASSFGEGAKRVLRVIATLAPVMEPHDAKRIAESIMSSLSSFATPNNVISDAVLSLNAICKAKASEANKGSVINKAWGSKLMELCEEKLQYYSTNPQLVVDESVTIEKQLLLVGELAMLEFDKEADKIENSTSVALLPVSPRTMSLVQFFLLDKVSPLKTCIDISSEPKEGLQVPVSIRICAFLTLGKLCLRDERFAKECITMLIRELRTGEHHEIRSNVLLILGDLCVRYTGLIDIYVPTMALSILDESPLIRRTAVLLFSQLILQDYVKWKDSLQRCFFRASVDDVEAIASLARYILCGPLLRKFPNLFLNKFTDVVFVLNKCKQKQYDDVEAEVSAKCALLGEASLSKRVALYQFMLQQLQDEQKLRVSMKLCTEVLEEVVEDRLQLCKNPAQITDSGTEAVLKDTFMILCSPAIKFARGVEADDDDDGDIDGNAETANISSQMAAAKGKLLLKLSKKNFLENIVPLLIGLKQKLESYHSPLMRYLLSYTWQLFRLYRQEVGEILSADPQMALEIEYDLRQYELQQKSRDVATRTANDANKKLKEVSGRRSSLQSPISAAHSSAISVEETEAALAETPTPMKRRTKSPKTKQHTSSAALEDEDEVTMMFSPNKKSDRRGSGEWRVSARLYEETPLTPMDEPAEILETAESDESAESEQSSRTIQKQTDNQLPRHRNHADENDDNDEPPSKIQRRHSKKMKKKPTETTEDRQPTRRSKRKRDAYRSQKHS